MPRLLLIDDDEHLAAPLAAYLKRFDLTLESALRPSVGLARLREGGFDAVILDVYVPGMMDGLELLQQGGARGPVELSALRAQAGPLRGVGHRGHRGHGGRWKGAYQSSAVVKGSGVCMARIAQRMPKATAHKRRIAPAIAPPSSRVKRKGLAMAFSYSV